MRPKAKDQTNAISPHETPITRNPQKKKTSVKTPHKKPAATALDLLHSFSEAPQDGQTVCSWRLSAEKL